MNNDTWLKPMKEGEHMTRICAVANEEQLAVSADSMFINKMTNEKSLHNKKLFFNNGLIIGMLGTSEVLTFKGNIYVKDCILEYLKTYTGKNILEVIEGIESDMRDMFSIFKLDNPTKIIFLWVDDSEFYCYALEIRYDRSEINFGNCHAISIYPFGKIDLENYFKYKFNNFLLDTGEGVDDIIINQFYTSSPFQISFDIVKSAVDDTRLTTVGGDVYTIIMDNKKNIQSFINGIESTM